MKRLLLMMCLMCLSAAQAAEMRAVPPQFWLKARSGAAVLAEPALSQAVHQLLAEPESALVVHHAREDESVAHAEELRGWLIALGVDAGRIRLSQSNMTDRTLKLEITEIK